MTSDVRPRRSALFMPASNARALEKARGLPADVLIFDLEDAVAPDAKETARRQAAEAVASRGYGDHEVVVRVNGLDNDWGADDLRAMTANPPHAVLLPKVESTALVRTAIQLLPETVDIWCMIETPVGIVRLDAIAAASPRVRCLVVGTSDLSADLGVRDRADRMPLLASLSHCVLVARANGQSVLDGVHLALDDSAGFRAVCEQGRDLGFDGKTLIHPNQIAACNDVFSPAPEAVAQARAVVEAFQAAEARGDGLVVLDGRLVENLHVRAAQRLLAMAAAIEAREQT